MQKQDGFLLLEGIRVADLSSLPLLLIFYHSFAILIQ